MVGGVGGGWCMRVSVGGGRCWWWAVLVVGGVGGGRCWRWAVVASGRWVASSHAAVWCSTGCSGCRDGGNTQDSKHPSVLVVVLVVVVIIH